MVPAAGPGDGRVHRNITALAVLWLVSGILRLMEVAWVVVFGRMFFWPWNWGSGGGWPFNGWPGMESLVWRGLLFGGVSLGVFAVFYLILAWSLFQRESWGRILGIVIGCLALLRFPFGTALGIYTLWVLLPESSAREYAAMAGFGPGTNPAR